MPSSSPPASTSPRPRRTARLVILVGASLLWHLFLYQWANGHVGIPASREEQPEVVVAELRSPPVPVVAPEKPAPSVKRKAKPRRTVPPAAPVVQPAAETTTTAAAPAMQTEPAPAFADVDPQPQITDPPPAEQAGANYKFDPPPSAELTYDVQAQIKGSQWFGNGVFRWQADGSRYSLTGEAFVTVLIRITALNFHSEGSIAEFGLAPVLYREKPRGKTETNTHFQREAGKISFSASEAVFPYKGGEQDRASVMWQLAGIGRGDPAQLVAGTAFDIVVAGVRNADTWRVSVVGQEEIDTPMGRMTAWHLARIPQAGSHEQKLDFWLAPQQDWYPARVRMTNANGDITDMLLSQLTRPAAGASSAGQQ